jgi:hypothetical protein
MEWPLTKIVFGLRHRRTFSFSSTAGHIIDSLINANRKVARAELAFDTIGWTPDGMAFQLKNKIGNMLLDCTIDGYVLTYHFQEKDTLTPDDLRKHFIHILDNSLHVAQAKGFINRVGIINYYSISTRSNAAKILFRNLLKIDIAGVPDAFSITFAMKSLTDQDLVDTTKNDYKNVIFNFSTDRSQEESADPPDLIDFYIDSQIYFNPERNYSSNDIEKHYSLFQTFIQQLKGNRALSFEEAIDGK